MTGRSVAGGPRPGSLADRLAPRPVVLAIEDDADIAAFLGAFFRASGLDLVHVSPHTSAEAVRAVREHQPSCVMLDLGLAGLSGIEVLDDLVTVSGALEVPVIVVSGDVRESTRRAVTARGATGFVAKPFGVRDLYEIVEDVVRRQSSGRA